MKADIHKVFFQKIPIKFKIILGNLKNITKPKSKQIIMIRKLSAKREKKAIICEQIHFF